MLKLDQKDDIDRLIEALEEMMDARDDMWYEEEYHNHREFLQIKDSRYTPAKDKLKSILTRILDQK